jgi:hypothetical protein
MKCHLQKILKLLLNFHKEFVSFDNENITYKLLYCRKNLYEMYCMLHTIFVIFVTGVC